MTFPCEGMTFSFMTKTIHPYSKWAKLIHILDPLAAQFIGGFFLGTPFPDKYHEVSCIHRFGNTIAFTIPSFNGVYTTSNVIHDPIGVQ